MRIEKRYSRYRADSELSRINTAAAQGQSIRIDEETGGRAVRRVFDRLERHQPSRQSTVQVVTIVQGLVA